MTYIIVFLAVIALFYWKSKAFEKIDREEKEALSKDGHATFIRTHYPDLVEEVLELTGWSIRKERDDAVFIRKSETEYIGLLQHSGRLNVVYVRKKQLIQQWHYPVGTGNEAILKDIALYVGEKPKSDLQSQQEQDISAQIWEQFGNTTGKRVIPTGHLLLLQQFVTDAMFVYNHPSNKTKAPSFLWKKELYLGDNSMIGYAIPYIWFKCMSKNDTETFNKSMDILNNEYESELNGNIDAAAIVAGIKENGFVEFAPDFYVNTNKRILEVLWRDSVCLKKLINFFGSTLNLANLLPGTDEVIISNGSTDFKCLVKRIANDFKDQKISLS